MPLTSLPVAVEHQRLTVRRPLEHPAPAMAPMLNVRPTFDLVAAVESHPRAPAVGEVGCGESCLTAPGGKEQRGEQAEKQRAHATSVHPGRHVFAGDRRSRGRIAARTGARYDSQSPAGICSGLQDRAAFGGTT